MRLLCGSAPTQAGGRSTTILTVCSPLRTCYRAEDSADWAM